MLDGIKNYLSIESTGALMVSGEWGCGKTYHIEKVVIPALQEEGWNPVKVSLFGIESVNEIPLRIADNYKRAKNDEGDRTKKEKSCWFSLRKEKAGKAVVKGAQLVSSISWIGSFVDVKTLVDKNSGLLYKLIPRRLLYPNTGMHIGKTFNHLRERWWAELGWAVAYCEAQSL